ncbi:MAG: hypothetical protein ACHQWU_05255 [Gemmatimonadales bacterium]
MRFRRHSLAQLALIVVAAIPWGRARAQGSIIDRAKKSMTDAASAAKKGLSDETTRQLNSAVDAAATAEVADGAFNAAVSPWTSSDGTSRVQLARFSGTAFMVTNGANRQVVLCDDRGILPWLASLTIADSNVTASGGSRGSSGGPKKAANETPTSAVGQTAATPNSKTGRGGAAADGKANSAAANGEVVQAGKQSQGASLPTAIGREYRLPSKAITLALPTANGANVGAASVGSLKIGNISESIFSGAAKVRFAQATIPGSKSKEAVDFGVVFKARVLAEGQTPGQCLTGGAAKSGAATTKGGDSKGSGPAPAQSPVTPRSGGESAAATPRSGGESAPATASPGPSVDEGDVLTPKLANVKLIADSKDDAKLVATLKKGEELVYLGQEQNGYLHVQGADGEGWVKKALLSKR